MASPNARWEHARDVVTQIASSHGEIEKDIWAMTPPVAQAAFQNVIKSQAETIDASIKTVVENLYSSKARFVFELIQNAEDCDYTEAAERGEMPFISFKVYPGRITIECNQDGFEEQNVRALCSLAGSSKRGRTGYIGEKGIGFKSVFMVASKVSVKSGPFSFCFKQNERKLGAWIINPVWEDRSEEELDENLTRMTLILNGCEEQKTAHQYFQGLENTVLLFLKKLQRIEVSFHRDDETLLTTTRYTSQYDEKIHRAVITKTRFEDGTILPEEKDYYHVTKKQFHGVPNHEHRKYAEEEGDRLADATAEVVLAFPVTGESKPIIRNQKVAAFLPIGEVGFSFLIQSDFVTRADREGVVEDSARNIYLLDGIAETFVDAVKQMCNIETLQYVWMKYLPKHKLTGTFWPRLVSKIEGNLSSVDAKVLRTRRDRHLKPIGQVKRISSNFMDSHKNPLFEDLKKEMYIAADYTSEDLDILSDFGLVVMDFEDAIARIYADTVSRSSRMKDPNTDNGWHSLAARYLGLPFKENWGLTCISAVQWLPIIPLKGGKWVPQYAVKGNLYYSQINGVSIPNDLRGLNLLGAELIENSERAQLFRYLGVKTADALEIRNLILQRYEKSRAYRSSKFKLENSLAHLKYLYGTDKPGESKIPSLCVYDDNNKLRILGRGFVYVYLKTNERYGPFEILRKIISNKGEVEAPGLESPFLHPSYVELSPPETSRPMTWKLWLQNYVGIRQHIQLTVHHLTGEDFSPAFKYVMDYRPEMVLGVLQFGWSHYSKTLTGTAEKLLSNAEILCENTRKQPLCEAYLPVSLLRKRCANFLRDETFPFVQLPSPVTDESCHEWVFLTRFGARMSENLEFYLRILDSILGTHPLAWKVTDPHRIFLLYEAIQSQCWGSEEKENQIKVVRDYFTEKKKAIYVPGQGSSMATWAHPQECLWEAPVDFETKYPMYALWDENFIRSDANAALLKQFFQITLKICDIAWEDLFLELSAIQLFRPKQLPRVQNLYRQLDGMRKIIKTSEANQIRDEFRNSTRIYVDRKNSWYAIKDCLWSSTAEITGKVTINEDYGDLEDFFVTFLRVEAPNISMLLDELVGLGRRRASTDKVKAIIWAINSLLKIEENPPLEENWKDANILPVILRDGLTEFRSSRSNFSVVDRQKLADAFTRKTAMLDFDLTEVRNLQPFLKWLGLEKRYLSRTVVEISRFDGARATLISKTDQDLCGKAEALFRFAVHFNSPRVQGNDLSLYRLLRRAKVYQTDGISRHLNLLENDGTITESVHSRSRLCIDENETELVLYVPRDARERELCYLGTLPQRMLDLIMTNPATLQLTNVESSAITVIGNILKSSSYIVNDLLEEAGIVPYTIPVGEQPAEEQNAKEDVPCNKRSSIHSGSPSSSASSRTLSTGLQRSEPQTPRSLSNVSEPSPRATPPPSKAGLSRNPYEIHVALSSATSALRATSVESRNPLVAAFQSDSPYEMLLDKIIRASQKAIFPTQGTFNMSALRYALPAIIDPEFLESTDYPSAFGVRSENQMKHDIKIGAAGELFVFEILHRLFSTLPGMVQQVEFTEGNWESKIRKYVKVHLKYAKMEDWSGQETADITYNDRKGIFTKFLREKGYLQSEIWENATPMYYLEVKTTTKKCDTRLFLSKAQYKRMHDCHNSNTEMVYAIIRVFNLNNDNIDMRIYMDPAAMEETQELNFAVEQWSVVPGRDNVGAGFANGSRDQG